MKFGAKIFFVVGAVLSICSIKHLSTHHSSVASFRAGTTKNVSNIANCPLGGKIAPGWEPPSKGGPGTFKHPENFVRTHGTSNFCIHQRHLLPCLKFREVTYQWPGLANNLYGQGQNENVGPAFKYHEEFTDNDNGTLTPAQGPSEHRSLGNCRKCTSMKPVLSMAHGQGPGRH